MENDYYKWIFIEPNEIGLTHLLQDKKKDEWWIVHASNVKFPVTYKDGNVKGIVQFFI